MKKFIILLISLFFCFTEHCYAIAEFGISNLDPNSDKAMEAYVYEYYSECDAVFRIGKMRITVRNEPNYIYRIVIAQIPPLHLDISEITIMSEFNSLSIPKEDIINKRRESGIEMVTDFIVCKVNPGDFNHLFDGVINKMLIIIKTTDQKEYRLYPSTKFINGAKKISKWS